MANHPIYQFYAELKDFKPNIWRRFQVTDDITVAQLGYIVQVLFEMTASHLMVIEYERPYLTSSGKLSKRMELICQYGINNEYDPLFDTDDADATGTKLSQLNLEYPFRLTVWYDFGDDWRVTLTLEEITIDSSVSGKEFPHVLTGKGFGIVEDCGGIWGLEELVEAFKEKQGEEYEQYCEWLGIEDFDIKAFDLDDMNFRLKKIPRIYKQFYEYGREPTEKSVDLIERKYLESGRTPTT